MLARCLPRTGLSRERLRRRLHRNLAQVAPGTASTAAEIGDLIRAELVHTRRDTRFEPEADDEIAAMPMGYDTLVGDMGSSLSGGQRQRLPLARALYRRPRLLVMDEGTSHLDPHLERLVNAAVATLGITRNIVAHRLETVLSAERIYTLGQGSLTDTTAEFAARRALHSPAMNFGMSTSPCAAH